jgi:hypothetical protein
MRRYSFKNKNITSKYMEFPGTRLKQLLPVSRDDIDISQWKSGNEPITMTSIVDGKVVEHKPYDFSNVFHSQPAPVTPPVLSNEPSTTGLCEQIELCELNSLVGDNSTVGKGQLST